MYFLVNIIIFMIGSNLIILSGFYCTAVRDSTPICIRLQKEHEIFAQHALLCLFLFGLSTACFTDFGKMNLLMVIQF